MIKRVFLIFGIILCCATSAVDAKSVYYNTNSHIYHKHSCERAEKCTKNCVSIDDSAARARGGRPCKICGG